MKSRILTCITAMTLFAALAIPVRSAAQDNENDNHQKHRHYKLIDMGTFGGPVSAVTSGGQPLINNRGVTVGWSATSTPTTPTSNPFICGGIDHFVPFITQAFEWNGAVTDLGALPGTANCSFPFAVNTQGQTVGASENGVVDPQTGVNELRAVLWEDGEMTDLGSFGGNQNVAQDINARGQIVGYSLNTIPDPFSLFDFFFFGSTNGTQARAFLLQRGQMQDLGTLGGPDALALLINRRGQIAGNSYTSSTPNPITGLPPIDPFFWENGKMADVGTLGGASGFVNALNNRGEVIGVSSLAANPAACFTEFDPNCHPFLWHQGKLIDLNTSTIGGSPITADAINDTGEIVGGAAFPSRVFDAYVWKNGVATDLGTLSGDCGSHASAINSRGQVVGNSLSCTNLNFHHAFLW